jgi:twitching motility protein PilT
MNRESLVKLLKNAATKGATEVHFKVPSCPLMRVNGSLMPTASNALSPRAAQEVVFSLCALAQLEIPVGAIKDHEFSFGLQDIGRFRAYVYRQRGSLSAVVQRVSTDIPVLTELGLGPDAEKVVGVPGLVLLCGRRRTELMAALVSSFNQRRRGHIVVLESPLSYLYKDAVATIAHREVGSDVPSFRQGIRQAVRIGVDLLVVGDVQEEETASAVLSAAEEGTPIVASVAARVASDAPWWMSRLSVGERRQDAERRINALLQSTLCVDGTDGAHQLDTNLDLKKAV